MDTRRVHFKLRLMCRTAELSRETECHHTAVSAKCNFVSPPQAEFTEETECPLR